MRLLVTGGCGFIGSHFIRGVLRRHPDWTVVNLDAQTYAGRTGNCRDLESDPRYDFHLGSVCDAAAVAAAFEHSPDAVVHFAAESHVDRSLRQAEQFARTNVEGTRVMLDASLRAGVERFVHISTDEVYGPVAAGRLREDAPLQPTSPYAVSKAAADTLAQSYMKTRGLPAVILRPCNTYGPNQHPEKMIPYFVTQTLLRRPVPLYGDGAQRRDWLHVSDLESAVEAALLRATQGSVYNVSAEWQCANVEMTRRLFDCLGGGELRHVADRPGHDRRYAVDAGRLRADLGWAPATGIDEGVAATVQWYRDHEAWWRAARDTDFDAYVAALYDTGD